MSDHAPTAAPSSTVVVVQPEPKTKIRIRTVRRTSWGVLAFLAVLYIAFGAWAKPHLLANGRSDYELFKHAKAHPVAARILVDERSAVIAETIAHNYEALDQSNFLTAPIYCVTYFWSTRNAAYPNRTVHIPGDPPTKPLPDFTPPLPTHGVKIVSVELFSAAWECSIESGDILLSYNGVPISSPQQLAETRDRFNTSESRHYPVEILRNGKISTHNIRRGKMGITSEPR